LIATLLAFASAAGQMAVPTPQPSVDPVAAEILRMGVESATELSFLIDANGKASDCTVERSSLSDKLDIEACTILTSRAQWSSVSGAGRDRSKRMRTRIVWRIEE